MAKFSTKWRSSKRPTKQRLYRVNAPLHIKHKLVSAHLTKDLRIKHKKRSVPVRKGDKVKILRGKFSGTIGEIERVSLMKCRILVKGVEIQKKSGAQKIPVLIDPSNVQIISLNLDDKKRVEAIARK